MCFGPTYEQVNTTANVDSNTTLLDNFWPRYDQKHDLPYLDRLKSVKILTKSKILMRKSNFLAINHIKRNVQANKTACTGPKGTL